MEDCRMAAVCFKRAYALEGKIDGDRLAQCSLELHINLFRKQISGQWSSSRVYMVHKDGLSAKPCSGTLQMETVRGHHQYSYSFSGFQRVGESDVTKYILCMLSNVKSTFV